MKKRTIALVMAAVMLFGVAIGGTIAWLTAQSDDVVNTFTVGDINIELDEAPLNTDGLTLNTTADRVKVNNNYKMIPGNELPKDPKVTVEPDSEAHWLFVKITETPNLDYFIDYHTSEGKIAAGWTKLDSASSTTEEVWYRTVDADTAKTGKEYPVLPNDKVSVKTTVTKVDMDALDGEVKESDYQSKEEANDAAEAEIANRPKLTFTAYAIQSANLTDQNTDGTVDAWDAWKLLNP